MSDAARILLVEDDFEICEVVTSGLRLEGHEITVRTHGAGLVEHVGETAPDLVVLDRTLPDSEGAELCRALRSAGSGVMILMLTARDSLEEKLEGLDAGADDYLTKPFALSELTARVKVLLRRAGHAGPGGQVPSASTLGPLRLDRAAVVADVDGTPLSLTATEFELLAALLENQGRVMSRTELLKAVWGYDFDPHTNVVEVYVSYLRRKLREATDAVILRNVRGFGYTVEASDKVDPPEKI
ncbi:two-component system, OmpR family, response regulator PrrA [Roseivivax lentus]|uniref:Two-component system, OmpR family, response regulator PrrA n=1 Tax=Roseivivax lentus TaxID=633194 RepID=A0A1N7PEJ1_9RHOB|nr:response regulator transcription factor [Roseivivax lentus]SIT08947.1 two-component system, OmpR family, response regulator PrrA [Roseivivax lentus]